MVNTNLIFIVAAPSGAGKTSLVRALLQKLDRIAHSVSHTTRAPRVSEVHGEHYYFISHDEYHTMQAQQQFVEHAEVFGHYYATSCQELHRLLAKGDVILDIDWQGARQVRQHFSNQVVTIFILPPSLAVLQARLQDRAQDDSKVIARRMLAARAEMEHYAEFDYIIVNERFEFALHELLAIVEAARLRTPRQQQQHQTLIRELLKAE